ncbi:hypothetical protein PIB30_084350 [Stylosanthes scabra]|uniref:Uncharacterized protein n=1 Tax=Stylosanthes scabra TaxID=79078 RepID=A0ABU6VTK3_9FABA|nr:hypothetical protein [Stylosanthes scabra]
MEIRCEINKGKQQLSERGFLMRHGALHAASQWMIYIGAKNEEVFKDVLPGIRAICDRVEGLGKGNSGGNNAGQENTMRDPCVVRTKGAPRTRGNANGGRSGERRPSAMGSTRQRRRFTDRMDSVPEGGNAAGTHFSPDHIVGTAYSTNAMNASAESNPAYHDEVPFVDFGFITYVIGK